MLSLGFSARDHFERAAQEAIHKFHRLILVRMFVFLALAMLPALLLGEIWLIGLFTIFLLLAFCLGMNAAILRWTKRRHRLKELLKTHDHHPDFSREVAVLCKRVGVCVIPVYSERSEDDFYVAFFPGLRVIILSFGAEKLLTEQDRLGVFAHEVAHAILPLNILAEFFGNSPIFHAREFAADAIGACFLSDARPFMFCLYKLSKATKFLEFSVIRPASHTHPPLKERINRLLDIDFHTRHAR